MKIVYLAILILITAMHFGFPIATTFTELVPQRNIANSIDNFNQPYQLVIKSENTAQYIFENPLLNFEVSIVNESDAQMLFQYLASQKNIPFQYLEGGCHARAHKMALLLEEKNIFVGKAFILGNLRVNVQTEKSNRQIQWPEHVAPFLLVRKDHELKTYVLDPSIFKVAVEDKDWIQIQTEHQPQPPPRVYYTPRFYYQSYSFAYISDKFESYDLESMQIKLDEYLKK